MPQCLSCGTLQKYLFCFKTKSFRNCSRIKTNALAIFDDDDDDEEDFDGEEFNSEEAKRDFQREHDRVENMPIMKKAREIFEIVDSLMELIGDLE